MFFPLFKELPISFFRPLSGKLAPIYWAAIHTLYNLDFEGEPFEITQDVAIEQTALLLEQTPEFNAFPERLREELGQDVEEGGPGPEAGADPGAEVGEERAARALARQLLKRLERCGWFDYEYRESRKGYVLNFRDYAARIIHTLTQVAQQEQPVFEGLAHSIKSALSQTEIDEKPGVALYNAQKSTRDLVREIKILSRNIHRYPERALKEASTAKALLELQLDIYQKKVVDSSYHRFKTTDNIFKYRSFILAQLSKLEDDPVLSASATQWISKNQALGYEDADARFDEWRGLIRSQMATIHVLTDDLDRKNARYTATTLQKISYLLNQERDLQGKLVKYLKAVAEMEDTRAWALDAGLPCFAVSHFDEGSLYVRPKDRAPLELAEIPLGEALDDERKRELIRSARTLVGGQYSSARVYGIALEMLRERGFVAVSEFKLERTEDLTRLVFLSYHGRDRRAPYELRLPASWKQTDLRIGRFKVRPGEFHLKEIQGVDS
ncbi:MAG: hypothetical protein HYW49_10410 [Deltaproteobacteria bacterium]|nr:hypothetical protein [Deltaproteobacteria bacterium]